MESMLIECTFAYCKFPTFRYTNMRKFEAKAEFLVARTTKAEKDAKRYKEKLEKLQFAFMAGEYVKMMESKGRTKRRMMKKLKGIFVLDCYYL